MKAYISLNYDGVHSAMVAARNLKEAAGKLRTSAHDLRRHGWRLGCSEEAALAQSRPEVIFYRPIDNTRGYPWAEHRWMPDRKAGVNYFKPRVAQP